MRWRQAWLAGASALMVAVSSVSALGQEWRRMDYPDDGFSVEFSGEVKVSPTTVTEETSKRIVRSTDYLQDSGGYAYIVGATLSRYSVDFTKGVEASYGSLKCKAKLGDTPLNFPRGQGREVSGTDCADDGSLRVVGRYYATDKWFYQVLAIFNKDTDENAARRFVGSFAILDK